jgi:glycosyltransferase involved in cell wall biosynthesis
VSISVVLATHNRASLLEGTLDRLRHQQYEPGDELIVIDNASTDATADIIAHAAEGFPVPLHRLHEARPGKTPALNSGIAAARGSILALIDDDVLVADDWVRTIHQIFRDPSVALVGGRVDPLWEHGAPRWLRVEQDGQYGPMSAPLALLHYGDAQELGVRTALGANMVVRRTVVDKLGGFAPHLGRVRGTLLCGEDSDFCDRAAAAGFRCEYRPELRVRHWVPADRMRLRYYLRWFFWSGITHAIVEQGTAPGRENRTAPPRSRYFVLRLVTASFSAFALTLSGRAADGAVQAMEAAFAVGYITQRAKERWERRAASAPAAIRAPGSDSGS